MSTCPKFMLRGKFEIKATFTPEIGKRFLLTEAGKTKSVIKQRVLGKNVFQLMGADGSTLIADARAKVLRIGRRKIRVRDCKKDKTLGFIQGNFINFINPFTEKFNILDKNGDVIARIVVNEFTQSMEIKKSNKNGDLGAIIATVQNRRFTQRKVKEVLRQGWVVDIKKKGVVDPRVIAMIPVYMDHFIKKKRKRRLLFL